MDRTGVRVETQSSRRYDFGERAAARQKWGRRKKEEFGKAEGEALGGSDAEGEVAEFAGGAGMMLLAAQFSSSI